MDDLAETEPTLESAEPVALDEPVTATLENAPIASPTMTVPSPSNIDEATLRNLSGADGRRRRRTALAVVAVAAVWPVGRACGSDPGSSRRPTVPPLARRRPRRWSPSRSSAAS